MKRFVIALLIVTLLSSSVPALAMANTPAGPAKAGFIHDTIKDIVTENAKEGQELEGELLGTFFGVAIETMMPYSETVNTFADVVSDDSESSEYYVLHKAAKVAGAAITDTLTLVLPTGISSVANQAVQTMIDSVSDGMELIMEKTGLKEYTDKIDDALDTGVKAVKNVVKSGWNWIKSFF